MNNEQEIEFNAAIAVLRKLRADYVDESLWLAVFDAAVTRELTKVAHGEYPFEKLQPGQSFTVPVTEADIAALNKRAKKDSVGGKRYAVFTHDALGVVEFACLRSRP